MKFIIGTYKAIKGDLPLEGAYEINVKYKSPKNEFTEKEWCADINSLEELLALVKDLGSIVISHEGYSIAELPTIQIFDEVCGA